jgi:hypothetical protein
MGLSEQLREGAVLERNTIPFEIDGTGSLDLGAAYVILGIQVDSPCRLRLYDNEKSVSDFAESIRDYEDLPYSTDIALIGDISMSVAGNYTLDPVLYAVPENTSTYLTYYRASDPITGSITIYKLEDQNVQADINNEHYKFSNRRTLEFDGGKNSLIAGEDTTARTYLLIDAISDEDCRLRIYGKQESLNNQTEASRSFSVVPDADVILIADMLLDSGSITKFFPKIIGANLQTLPTNLETIRLSRTAINSFSEIYYRIEPQDPFGPVEASDISVSMNIFALED